MMKKSTLFLLLLVSAQFVSNAQPGVCPGTAQFITSQAQLNQFPIDWPNCQVLQSRFEVGTIGGSTDITDLTPLSNLTGAAFQRSFYVHFNPLLTSLAGLDNLANMGGDLTIEANPLLTDLQGLGGIQTIDGIIKVQNNDGLQTLSGLSNALTIVESIVVIENDVLQDFAGVFDNLQEVKEYVFINWNPMVTSINTLNNVTSVGQYLNIERHSSMTALNAFNSLQTVGLLNNGWDFEVVLCPNITSLSFPNLSRVGGNFEISENNSLSEISFPSLDSVKKQMIIDYNPSLTSLVGLGDFTLTGPLTIAFNSSLSECEAYGVCNYLDVPANTAFINQNATGCANRAQVEAACALLPVELTFFKAHDDNGDALLSWQTASEKDNAYFHVYHSADGVNFTRIGSVRGNGTSAALKNYTFRHTRPSNGNNYYRLKQEDYDGTIAHSPIVRVAIKGSIRVDVYPNPTTGYVKIKGDLTEGTVRLKDVTGRLISEQQLPARNWVDLTRQDKGIYLLEIQIGHELLVKRVVKE